REGGGAGGWGARPRGEPPMMGMLHPPAGQEPPDRAVPGTSGKATTASAPRASSASLRMAGPSTNRDGREGAGRAARVIELMESVPVNGARLAGAGGRRSAFSEPAGRTIAEPASAEKSKITRRGRCTNYKEMGQKLQDLVRDLEAKYNPARRADGERLAVRSE